MAIGNKCKQCGGSLEFDPQSTNLICKKCGNNVTFEKSQEYHFHDFNMYAEIVEPEFNPKVMSSHCSNCGASFTSDAGNISGTCQYCGAHLTSDFSLSKESEPDACIPFAFDKEMAKTKFLAGLKKKKFLPNNLIKQFPDSTIESVYIPAYIFNVETENGYVGRIYRSYKRSDGSTERDYDNIRGSKTVVTDNILVECSSRLNQLTLDQIRPFDLGRLMKFKEEYLMGYSVEYYDKKLQDAKSLVEESVKFNVRKAILKNYSYDGVDYLNINTKYVASNYARVFLPTYSVTYKYNGKDYTTFLNGQTGKVGGNLPRSKVKIGFLIFGIMLMLGLFIFLIAR